MRWELGTCSRAPIKNHQSTFLSGSDRWRVEEPVATVAAVATGVSTAVAATSEDAVPQIPGCSVLNVERPTKAEGGSGEVPCGATPQLRGQ